MQSDVERCVAETDEKVDGPASPGIPSGLGEARPEADDCISARLQQPGSSVLTGLEVGDGCAVGRLALTAVDERVPIELVAHGGADSSRSPAVDHTHLR